MMFSEFLRDHAFAIAWFGLMTLVWFGWAQEDPPESRRWKLGVGSVLGLVLTGIFGFTVFQHWHDGSALDGQFHLYGILVATEVVFAVAGAIFLALKKRSWWIAWWVALVVAIHFIPMALLLRDVSMAILGVVQVLGLVVLVPRLKRQSHTTSRDVGPFMGITLLAFAIVSAAIFLIIVGSPFDHHGA